jgi:hypothetical protein
MGNAVTRFSKRTGKNLKKHPPTNNTIRTPRRRFLHEGEIELHHQRTPESSITLKKIERNIPRRDQLILDPHTHGLCTTGKSHCTITGHPNPVEFYNTLKKIERNIPNRDTPYDSPSRTLCTKGESTSTNQIHATKNEIPRRHPTRRE